MKSIKNLFLKGVGALTMIGILSVVLGSSLFSPLKANAEVVLASVAITASPGTIEDGQSARLSWSSTDATSVSISPGIGSVTPYGETYVSPTRTTTYTITGTNSTGGYATASATVVVRSSPNTCDDPAATNYGGSLPCRYEPQTCQDRTAINYGGSLPCRYDQLVSVAITASPGIINRGESSRLEWSSTNADNVTITNLGSVSRDGSRYVSPTQTTTYTITGTNSSGRSATASATVVVRDAPPQVCEDRNAINYGGSLPCRYDGARPTVNVTANPSRVDYRDSSTISWTSTNADTCIATGGANNWGGSTSRSGSTSSGSLTRNTTFTVTCSNQYGSATDSATVTVDDDDDDDGDAPTVNIYANPSSVNYNGSSTITWNSRDADTCRSTGGTSGWAKSSQGRSGTFYATGLTRDTTFHVTCKNDEGSDSDSVTVRVGGGTYVPPPTRPTVNIYADNTNLSYGGTTFVRWNTTNATSCYASGGSTGWSGAKSIGPASFYTGSLTGSRTYTLTCSNAAGSATDSVTVNVRGRTVTRTVNPAPRPGPSSLVIITSSIDKNQPIVPTLDNTRPHVGDEINYTVTYKNIGTASISNLILRLDLPYEVTYMFSTPSNPQISGNTLIFNLGSLGANREGTVSVRVRVREDAPAGALLNFPAVLSYTDPSGYPQSVSANVSAQVWSGSADNENLIIDEEKTVIPLGASIFGAGFWPTTLFGWLLFLILILILVLLARSLFAAPGSPAPWTRKTITTVQH